jgi:hypothetical protein
VREFTHRTNRQGLLEGSTILVPAFDHSTHVVMDSFQATKISRSSPVCCVLGSKESSVGRKHGQLTADDGTCDCLWSMRQLPLPLLSFSHSHSRVAVVCRAVWCADCSWCNISTSISGRSLIQLGYSMPWTGHCFIPMIKSIHLLTESRQRDN